MVFSVAEAQEVPTAVPPTCDGPFFAQGGGPGPGGQGRPGGGKMREHRRHLEQIRLVKLLEFLDLPEDQETDFLLRFKQLRTTERELEKEHRQIVTQLASVVDDPAVSDEQIEALVDDAHAVMEKRLQAMQAFMNDIREWLTPRQLARIVVFNDRFEYQLLSRLRQFRDRKPRRMRDTTNENVNDNR
jgi:hypothetical protein